MAPRPTLISRAPGFIAANVCWSNRPWGVLRFRGAGDHTNQHAEGHSCREVRCPSTRSKFASSRALRGQIPSHLHYRRPVRQPRDFGADRWPAPDNQRAALIRPSRYRRMLPTMLALQCQVAHGVLGEQQQCAQHILGNLPRSEKSPWRGNRNVALNQAGNNSASTPALVACTQLQFRAALAAALKQTGAKIGDHQHIGLRQRPRKSRRGAGGLAPAHRPANATQNRQLGFSGRTSTRMRVMRPPFCKARPRRGHCVVDFDLTDHSAAENARLPVDTPAQTTQGPRRSQAAGYVRSTWGRGRSGDSAIPNTQHQALAAISAIQVIRMQPWSWLSIVRRGLRHFQPVAPVPITSRVAPVRRRRPTALAPRYRPAKPGHFAWPSIQPRRQSLTRKAHCQTLPSRTNIRTAHQSLHAPETAGAPIARRTSSAISQNAMLAGTLGQPGA